MFTVLSFDKYVFKDDPLLREQKRALKKRGKMNEVDMLDDYTTKGYDLDTWIMEQAIEREDLEHDPRFELYEPRVENHVTLYHTLKEVFLSKTWDEWKPRLEGIPFAVAQNLTEVITDPQARANDFFISYNHPTYGRIEAIANPVKLSRTPATMRTPAPEFSQHTEEVLLELGYTWEDIAQFKEQGVIA